MSDVSVVIRTYNEAKYLPALLDGIEAQNLGKRKLETIVVDSGSDDGTPQIARRRDARVVPIKKSEFTFGRSLNIGCDAAKGKYLVIVSGHCIPYDREWICRLIQPLEEGVVHYSYGRQVGDKDSRFSEHKIFEKYFPHRSKIPQNSYFVNNANSAIRRDVWEQYKFDEELTGLEDMALAKKLRENSLEIGYVADACVYHLHQESWAQVERRYEREALALQAIMPDVHVHFPDFLRYYASAVLKDTGAALADKKLRRLPEILAFRFFQYWGAFKGNREQRQLSRSMKEKYFYPS